MIQPPHLRRTVILTQILNTAKKAPGLWPFVLLVVFQILEDGDAGIDCDCFAYPPPRGMGIASILTGCDAPLNMSVLKRGWLLDPSTHLQQEPIGISSNLVQVRFLSRCHLNGCKRFSTLKLLY